MTLDALSRWSFGITISLHYIFPLLTMGGFMWLFMQSLGSSSWATLKKNFSALMLFTLLGVSTGYVLKWHFENIWTPYYNLIAEMFDPIIKWEAPISLSGFTLFFTTGLWSLKKEKRLFFQISAGALVLTTLVSAFSITAVNSWMQFPSGVRVMSNPLANAVERMGLWQVVFSPTFPLRFAHVLLGAALLGGTWQMLKSERMNVKSWGFLMLIWLGQLYVGHRHAGEVYAYQPEKFAAFEGHQSFFGPADLYLLPTKNHWMNLKLEGATSFMMFNDGTQPIYGLDAWKEGYLTDALDAVFKTYHLMVMLHFLIFGLLVIAYRQLRKNWATKKWVLWAIILLSFVANYAGWYTAEMGRQPWIVRGILLTKDASVPTGVFQAYLGVGLSVVAWIVPILLWNVLDLRRRIYRWLSR
jgi:cytochrome d ubiquinol oxidase subunit I